jgi:hypothetical protein
VSGGTPHASLPLVFRNSLQWSDITKSFASDDASSIRRVLASEVNAVTRECFAMQQVLNEVGQIAQRLAAGIWQVLQFIWNW